MQKITDIEIVLRFLDNLGGWIDGGLIMSKEFEYAGKKYFIGYRGNRNVRELATDLGDADEFTHYGEYNGIRYVIHGRKRLTESGKKIRQYKAAILHDPRCPAEPVFSVQQGTNQMALI
jgi:hypothetical protein